MTGLRNRVHGKANCSKPWIFPIGVGIFVCMVGGISPGISQSAAHAEESILPSSSTNVVPFSSDITEPHLANIRQLTVGRKNAKAYFSPDGDKVIFQSTNNWSTLEGQKIFTTRDTTETPLACYQMYTLDLETEEVRLVSTGRGATTSGYFFPGGRRVLFSSTHLAGMQCPPQLKRGPKDRWALDDYDIFTVRVDGLHPQRLTATPGYDAEATISPDGRTMVFTSRRGGDLDIYSMHLDGTHIKRLTHEIGYEGGAFFSPDSRRIVYQASHPQNGEEADAYQSLLKHNVVEPGNLELFIMNVDGTGKHQVTDNGASNMSPCFYPDGRRVIFSSNVHSRHTKDRASSKRPTFHLYLIDEDGKNRERITRVGAFNSFPMFSPDGRRLIWMSNRYAKSHGEYNVFLADWVP